MASSEHCLCVSKPRCLRISWKVTSSCQRITNQQTIFCGSASRSVHRRAWVLNSPSGSRIRTQRTGTPNKPVEYQTAVFLEETSTMRSLSPYQLAIVVGFQTVFGASATTERFGKRSPLRRGLPLCPSLSRTAWWGTLVEGSIQAQAGGDEGDRIGEASAAVEQFERCVGAISDGYYLSLWVHHRLTITTKSSCQAHSVTSSCGVCPAWRHNARKEQELRGKVRPTLEKPRGSPPPTSRKPTA